MITLEFIYVFSTVAVVVQAFIEIKEMKDVYIRDILDWLVVLLLAMTPVLNTLVFVTLLYTSPEIYIKQNHLFYIKSKWRQFLNIKLR